MIWVCYLLIISNQQNVKLVLILFSIYKHITRFDLVSSETTSSWSLWSRLLQSGLWSNGLWEVEVLTQVLNTLIGKGVVVVLPGELSLNVTLRGQGLQSLDDIQVSGVNLLVLWLVEVLLGDSNTLYLNMLVNDLVKTTAEWKM